MHFESIGIPPERAVRVKCRSCMGRGEVTYSDYYHDAGEVSGFGCTETDSPCIDCYGRGWVEIYAEDMKPGDKLEE